MFLPRLLRLRTFSPLGHRDYRYLWTAVLLINAGQWIERLTLGWLLYDITASPFLLGAIDSVRYLPFLVSGPLAGVVADRADRRKLLMGIHVTLMVAALSMWPLVASDSVGPTHLFLFALVSGVAWSINQPIRHSLLPKLVPKKDLAGAVALSSMGANINKILAPTLGGFLIIWFGAGGNFLVQGAAYAGALFMIYLLNVRDTTERTSQRSAWAELREGSTYVLVNPPVLILLASTLIVHVVAMPSYQVLLPVFQKDVLSVGPEGLGFLMAAPGVGSIAALLFVPFLTDSSRRHTLAMLFGLVMLGGSLVLFSLSASLLISLVVLTAVGFFRMLVLSINMAMLQIDVPDAIRGRVLSIYMLDRGLIPIGALFAGTTAQLAGARSAVTVMGSSVILMAVLLAWYRLRRGETGRTVS